MEPFSLAYNLVNLLLLLLSLAPAQAPDAAPTEPPPACTAIEQAACLEVAPVP